MKYSRINCGFVPLVDSASLIIAHELDFAAQEGLELSLLKQPSWSALRDLLALGHLDVAHMLSPLPIAMTLGLGGFQAQVDALMVLSVNGNVVGASGDVISRMKSSGWMRNLADAESAGSALAAACAGKILRVGVPFPHSMHRELIEYWLGSRNIDLEIRTVPPPLMAEALAQDEIDVFCVGEPWGSQAVDAGSGEIIIPGRAIWSFAPEKVLAAKRSWVEGNSETAGALMRAVYKAGKWLNDPTNRLIATDVLSRSAYLGLPADMIERALTGQLFCETRSIAAKVDGFLHFHAAATNFPWRSQASWIGARMARRHGLPFEASIQTARSIYRSDIYRSVFSQEGIDLPGASDKLEGALTVETPVASAKGEVVLGPDAFFDGQVFDPFQQ